MKYLLVYLQGCESKKFAHKKMSRNMDNIDNYVQSYSLLNTSKIYT